MPLTITTAGPPERSRRRASTPPKSRARSSRPLWGRQSGACPSPARSGRRSSAGQSASLARRAQDAAVSEGTPAARAATVNSQVADYDLAHERDLHWVGGEPGLSG